MAIISANLQFNRGGHGLLDYSSLQTNYSAALAWAQDANSNAAVGQFIYLAEAETIEGVEYAKGPYVVDAIGEGAVLTPLSKSVAGEQDLAGAITDLKSSVGTLTTNLAATDASVNALETVVDAIDETYATKEELEDAIGNVDFSALATKEELTNGLADKADASVVYTKDEVDTELAKKLEADDVAELASKTELSEGLANKADASVVYTKEEAEDKFVAKEGYVEYTTDEKNKLAGIAEGAEVNYIKSVGDNLSVDENGKLEVSIPEVEVPFQSVAESDKVLKLENGVLSSTLSYVREEVDGVDSLVLKGLNGDVIGNVPVADFVADGMLESVTPVEGTNKFKFTFKKVDGSTEDFEVDFGKFVDVYHGDNATIELNSETNTFSVKANVFDAHGAAATAEQNAKDYADGKFQEKGDYEEAGAAAAVEAKLNEYKSSNDAALESGLAAKVDVSSYNDKMTEIDGSISSINASIGNVYTKTEVDGLVSPLASKEYVDGSLNLKANVADVYSKTAVDTSVNAAIAAAIAPLATTEALNTGLADKVNSSDYNEKIGSIEETIETLAVKTDVSTALDLKANVADVYTKTEVNGLVSPLAVKADVDTSLAGKVDVEEGKSLVSNELIAKLGNLAVINTVSTSDELKLENGTLSLDLGAYAKTTDVNSGLATKLDASAKVNGVSFVDGQATIDGEDIALGAAITRTGENDAVENVYEATTSIQSVLASLSQRIDVLDPNVSGELGITSIVAGNGINANVSGGQATISVKASEVEGNMAEVKTDGVYVADMRSYWQAI